MLFITLCSFAFTNTATAMLCDIADTDKTETHNSVMDIENCHNDQPQQSSDNSLDDCCHDMNLCHASFVLSNNDTFNQIDIVHFSIQKRKNDHLVINSSSPPDRPPKYFA